MANEERDTILTMLTPPRRTAHLVMNKIYVGRDPKNPTTSFNGQNLNFHLNGPISTDSFQNPQILRTISSVPDDIHSPSQFPVWGFIMTIVIVISFVRERKLHQMFMHLKQETQIIQSLTKLNDKI